MDAFVAQVRERSDILGVVASYVPLKRKGGRYWGCCPFHSEKTPSFSVVPDEGFFYCFGCHAGGNVFKFISMIENVSYFDAIRMQAEKLGIEMPEREKSEKELARERKLDDLRKLAEMAQRFFHNCLVQTRYGEAGLRYFAGRGVGEAVIEEFGLGFAPDAPGKLHDAFLKRGVSEKLLLECGLVVERQGGVYDKFRNRVMIPIADDRGRVVGFGGRVLGDGKPKYLNSPESSVFNKRMHLYALNYARSSRKGYLILCEGYMDVITMHQAGFTNACASLGTALTAEQAGLVRRFAGEVRLLYDSDGAGIGAALRAIPILKEAGIASRVVSLRPHKDPDEFLRAEGAEKFEERLDAAENAFLFEADQLASGVRRDDPAAWTEFERKLADRLTAISEPLERRNYTEAAAARFSIPQDELEDLVRRRAAMGTPAETFRKPRSLRRPDEKEDADVTAQKLMLAYLAAYPEAYQETKDLIDASDFTDPLCSALSKGLYVQLEEGGPAEARLVAMFDDPEEQSRAAALFHTSIPVQSAAELDRAFTGTVRRMIRSGSEAAMRQAAGQNMAALSRFIARKKILEQFDRGKLLSLHDPRFENEKRR